MLFRSDIFKDLIDEGYVAVYMDNILVYTHMIEHHREVVTRVLDVLQNYRLYLKVEKCTFECTMVEYLGLVLSEGWVEMDPVRSPGSGTGRHQKTSQRCSPSWAS